jgi:hypothetical protein
MTSYWQVEWIALPLANGLQEWSKRLWRGGEDEAELNPWIQSSGQESCPPAPEPFTHQHVERSVIDI